MDTGLPKRVWCDVNTATLPRRVVLLERSELAIQALETEDGRLETRLLVRRPGEPIKRSSNVLIPGVEYTAE